MGYADNIATAFLDKLEKRLGRIVCKRGIVATVTSGMVAVREIGSTTAGTQLFAKVSGFQVAPGDEVLIVQVNGVNVIVDRIYRAVPSFRTFEGGISVLGLLTLGASGMASSGPLTASAVTAAGSVQGADLIATDDLDVAGDAAIDGQLDLGGNLIMSFGGISTNTIGVTTVTASGLIQAADLTATDDLLVNDDATIQGDLQVNGLADVNGSLTGGSLISDSTLVAAGNGTFGGKLQSVGVPILNGTKPTHTLGTGAGTGPSSVACDGGASSFHLRFVCGTSPGAAGSTICTFTFPAIASSAYDVLIQAADSDAAARTWYWNYDTRTTTTFTIHTTAALAAGASYRINLQMTQRPA